MYYICEAPDTLEQVHHVNDLAVKPLCVASTNPLYGRSEPLESLRISAAYVPASSKEQVILLRGAALVVDHFTLVIWPGSAFVYKLPLV